MSVEIDAVKTPVDKTPLFVAMAKVWPALFSETLKRESLILLISQWALETGHGDSMWCYNLGNVKAKPGGNYDYCYFACNELLVNAIAQKMQAADPTHAKVTAVRKDGNSWIWFYPRHVGCCFRAFRTLEEGVAHHLVLMQKRFYKAWPSVLAGDPASFCHLLRQQGYYTADEASYTKGVVSVFSTYSKALADVPLVSASSSLYDSLTSAEFNISSIHTPTADEECHIYSPYSAALLEAA